MSLFHRVASVTALLALGAVAASAQKPKPRVTEAAARATALQAVPGGKIQSHEYEHEKGLWIYSYDIKVAGKPGIEEINVDAMTGKVVAHEHEGPKAEGKEARDEGEGHKKP